MRMTKELVTKAFEDGFLAGYAFAQGGADYHTAWILWYLMYLSESANAVQDCIDRSGSYSNPID